MRRDFWEVVGVGLLVELSLRIIHAIFPNQTSGILPITGDDIKQTGIVLMAAVVAYGIYRFLHLPPDDPNHPPQERAKDRPAPPRLTRQKLASRPSATATDAAPMGTPPSFLAPKRKEADPLN